MPNPNPKPNHVPRLAVTIGKWFKGEANGPFAIVALVIVCIAMIAGKYLGPL